MFLGNILYADSTFYLLLSTMKQDYTNATDRKTVGNTMQYNSHKTEQ